MNKHMDDIVCLVIIFWALFFLSGCGPEWDPDFYCKMYEPEVESVEEKVVNGDPITEETNLSTLALFRQDEVGSWHQHCSAVAYRPQIVLTAAHCVPTAKLGVSRERTVRTITKVDDVYVHRNYVSYPDFDLAILHLEEPIEGPFPAGIYDPVAGGYEPDFRYFCTGMVAQGFGDTRGTNPRGLYSIPYEIGYASHYVLETGPVNPDTGLCGGDSGGGLYAYMSEDHAWVSEDTFMIAGIAIGAYDKQDCTSRTKHIYLESYSMWVYEVVHCMNGGEDRLWPFYILDGGAGYRGNTCDELRKEL